HSRFSRDWSSDVCSSDLEAIRQIIKGNFKDSLGRFKRQMKAHAEKMEFEQAQRIKEKIEVLEKYQAKSTVVNPKINNVDVFSIRSEEHTSELQSRENLVC